MLNRASQGWEPELARVLSRLYMKRTVERFDQEAGRH